MLISPKCLSLNPSRQLLSRRSSSGAGNLQPMTMISIGNLNQMETERVTEFLMSQLDLQPRKHQRLGWDVVATPPKVFVDHPSFHRPGNPYGDAYGAFGDNQFRFTLLCHAACEAPLVLPLGGFTYGEKCLFLANDWHAGLVPVLLAAKYRPYGVYNDARSIVVIHNLAHQGVEPASTYSNFGLPPEWYGAMGWVFPTWARTHALDTDEAVNILKGAIVTADRILTVSQGYSSPEGGNGLDELLTSRKTVMNDTR